MAMSLAVGKGLEVVSTSSQLFLRGSAFVNTRALGRTCRPIMRNWQLPRGSQLSVCPSLGRNQQSVPSLEIVHIASWVYEKAALMNVRAEDYNHGLLRRLDLLKDRQRK
jgi:hypothetical protein